MNLGKGETGAKPTAGSTRAPAGTSGPAASTDSPNAATGRLYDRTFDLDYSGVGVMVAQQYDGTIWLHFGNEAGAYSVELTPQESAELRATLAAAESGVKHRA